LTILYSGLMAVFVGVAAGCGGGSGGNSQPVTVLPQTDATIAVGDDFDVITLDASTLGLPDSVSTKANPAADDGYRIYAVQLRADPAVAYKGGIEGLSATKPKNGERFNSKTKSVNNYVGMLKANQMQVLQSVGAGKPLHHYTYAFNGFAARLTSAQVAMLRQDGAVVNVWENVIRHPQTDSTPNYIGLTREGSLWAQGYRGEGVVVGVIDTGIWPEHPSFADDGSLPPPPDSWSLGVNEEGTCEFGNMDFNPLDAAFECNNKLIYGRAYAASFGDGQNGELVPGEFLSTRDNDGHGSHTATTAAGNAGVEASIGGQALGTVSGMAPKAHVAAAKVCWNGTNPPDGFFSGCGSIDSAAAIDDLVGAGVDVINFSIGGAGTSFSGADDIAFLFAADAGVFSAVAIGNSGPGAGTADLPGSLPWVTAVGATQDDQVFNTGVGISRPTSLQDIYVAIEGAGPVTIADAGRISSQLMSPSDPANFEGCGPWGNMVPGYLALVSRGLCSFNQKFVNATAAGAVGIIVYNNRPGAIVMGGLEGTTIPGVMIQQEEGLIFQSIVSKGNRVVGSLDPAISTSAKRTVADFSSRGPNGGGMDIIKPDVSAPGASILAGQTPIPNDGQPPGELFQIISGTSMASPHVAGVGALMVQAHPDWSPEAIRSAIMTGARNGIATGLNGDPATPFDVGAGELRTDKQLGRPSLVYEAGFLDYLAFLCGAAAQAGLVAPGTCADLAVAGYSLDPSDLNLPSIGIGELVGNQTITRSVTSVSEGDAVYTVRVDRPKGISVRVTPSTLALAPGETAEYQVTFTAQAGAAVNEWTFGSLKWTSSEGSRNVRSPIAIRPVALDTVAEVHASGAEGSVAIPVGFGYSGPYMAELAGIGESFPVPGNVSQDEGLDVLCADLPDLDHLRFATYDQDTTTPGSDDIDLRLFLVDNCTDFNIIGEIGRSAGPTSEEVIDISDAPAFGYAFVIDYFGAATGTDIDYIAYITGVLGDDGNATITSAPDSATSGTSGTVNVDYAVNPGTRGLGMIKHHDGDGELGRTLIDVDAL